MGDDGVKLNEPAYWRRRAQEARAIAESLRDPDAKQTMRGIAESYDKLAEQAARLAKNG